ncbi:aspartic proteinase CDR1-like [Cucumis melo var. makuwa]|uniref:Aspartic proteinase CDR1-like n=1 Tax=Cucumis melo var. makuwa TaxID=1194695 RepID=A0A5A7TAJ2_CUCMM|nr:aspartic proteinase CDR1-like [Cucumis melo var. makuwa]TYK24524.1 aspartic proteinase CDR1-like [Cucumis melo var. makuwa]
MAPNVSLVIVFLICTAVVSVTTGHEDGFTVELIHRDSRKSPMYNPSENHYLRVANTLRRSISRNTAGVVTNTVEAPIFNNRGEYLMKLSLGTPPFPIIAVADTGSDIIWTQCEPCIDCYKQDAPMFNPSKSTTYSKVSCSSPICSFTGDDRRSCSSTSECMYSISYGDNSHSEGDFALDTLSMDSTSGRLVAFPRTAIGCGHDNSGTFDANVSGIVGLGLGPASLVKQMGSAVAGKFSYCLTPIGSDDVKSNKLNFGSNANVSGSGAVSTPIYISDKFKSFYSLKLKAVSVERKNIFYVRARSSILGEANIIIDSGTTLTLLPADVYQNFAEAISNSINLQRTDDPNRFLNYCFATTTDDYKMPHIAMHFEGANVRLHRENVLVRVSDDVVCLAFASSQDNDISIYGNIAQINFLVGYDINNMSISFKRANCVAM